MSQLSSYQTETRRVIGVLQQWQVLLSSSHVATEITLADLEDVTASLREAFGATIPIEAIIQQLVSQDLREQIEQRRCA